MHAHTLTYAQGITLCMLEDIQLEYLSFFYSEHT